MEQAGRPTSRQAASREANNPVAPALPGEEGRSARKRRAILEAATGLFLSKGYEGTSMDEVAAIASVSKQTVYKNFDDKTRLFSEIVTAVAARAEAFASELPELLDARMEVDAALTLVARRYIETVTHPQVLQLRRLVIGEADRFPALARAYYERVPGRTLATLAERLTVLMERGLLRAHDPEVAAVHFAYLVLGQVLDRAMFLGADASPTTEEVEDRASGAVRVFLAAYGA